jgi:hypothetical protein
MGKRFGKIIKYVGAAVTQEKCQCLVHEIEMFCNAEHKSEEILLCRVTWITFYGTFPTRGFPSAITFLYRRFFVPGKIHLWPLFVLQLLSWSLFLFVVHRETARKSVYLNDLFLTTIPDPQFTLLPIKIAASALRVSVKRDSQCHPFFCTFAQYIILISL